MENEKTELLKALAVCAEITGSDLSEGAARVMAEDLSRYPHQQVLGALTRCRRELTGRITLAAIITRLDDGRPGPQEAWAIVAPCLRDEGPTIVWTDDMAQAFGVALSCEDSIAARMAFLESYNTLCQQARDAGRKVTWTQCLGHDQSGRDGPLLAAVAAGRLSISHAQQFLTGETARADLLRLSAPHKAEFDIPKSIGHNPDREQGHKPIDTKAQRANSAGAPRTAE